MSRRYAIYFAPSEASLLWRTGSRWLGRDAARDTSLTQPAVPGYNAERVGALTRSARSYGFHATLKPPFHLAEEGSAPRLCDALAAFAGQRAAFAVPPLEVASLSGFLALRPSVPEPALQALADDCVTAFDHFRRPAQASELARRRGAGLSERQGALLARFGYPYVLDQFRFHMTLTERLEPGATADLKAWLQRYFAAALQEPTVLADLCLFVQERPGGHFGILQRFPLKSC